MTPGVIASLLLTLLWPFAPSQLAPERNSIPPITVRDGSIFDALVAVRQARPDAIVFGFEDDGTTNKASFNTREITIGELPAFLQREYAPYRVALLDSGIVQVQPIKPFVGSSLLDLKIAHFEAHGRRTVGDIIEHLTWEVPELRQLVYPVQPEKVGAETSGGMEPQVDFTADNLTLRELLNRLAVYSLKVSEKSPQSGISLSAVSWRFRFIPDNHDLNRIGGHPEFSTF